jgi:glycosyltransferase involved in cell wall biosynthesis
LIKQGNAFAVNYPIDSKPLRILFPGNIHSAKGAELIVELKALDIENRLEFHFLGTVTEALKSHGIYHGRYQRTDFTKLVSEIQPNYIGVFSIWPETYCHTLTESWASGVPVIAIDLGAVGERIERHGGGWLISPELKPSEMYARLLQIASDTEGYMSKVSEVNRWQLSYGRQNKIATMAQKYHQLYQRVLSSCLSFPPHDSATQTNLKSSIKLGVFIHNSANNQSPPSAHIRVLEWLQCHSISQHINFQLIDIDSFIYDRHDVFELDMVLVQRNIIKPHLANRFINHCQKRNLPIVFEIDDDLTNVPPEKDPTGIYAKTAMGIKAIVAASSTVIVSTELLGKKLSQYNSNIVVVPNTISESIWFRPLAAENSSYDWSFDPDKVKILYMGNPTHGEDLAMVKPVFEKLVDEGYPIQLYVIGGEPESESKNWYQRISIPAASRHYPQFVPWFRQLAKNFTLAIAPLVENEFNQCKSPLKYLQYSAVGLPTVCSNVTPYKELVSDQNGFLVDNTAERWYQVLVNAIDNLETLPNISHNAREFVVNQYGMSNYTEMYLDIFQKLMVTNKIGD